MKNSSVFFFIGILIVAVGLAWFISGGLAGSLTKPSPAPVPTGAIFTVTETPEAIIPAAPEMTTAAAVPATSGTAAGTPAGTPVSAETPASTTGTARATAPVPASSDQIRQHFLDVAYTATNRLERVDYDPSRPRVVISSTAAGRGDIALIERTAKVFNEASPTVKLSENVKESGTGDIFIKFLTEDGLEVIKLNEVPETGSFSDALTRRELYQGDIPAAKIVRGTIYLNANLPPAARDHVLVRSLLYEMGFTGESTLFPDSVFYAGENTNTELTVEDRKIITMLYGDEFYNGMNMDDLRRIIYLP